MEVEIVRSVLTVLSFVSFLGVVAWAYTPTRRERFDRDAMMPFSHRESAAGGDGSCGVRMPAATMFEIGDE